jgi:hypothetical protein
MNGHRSDLTTKDALTRESTLCVAGALIESFGRSNIYIIDHNPSRKENQRQKRESLYRDVKIIILNLIKS